jgi:DNA-binding CsgD family transcriptional regulator
MEDPLPICISRAKDGTYVEVNKAALKIMGLPRKKVIGHTSIELGFISPELRILLIDDIKKQGFAKNIPGKVNINNQVVVNLLFRIHPIKIGKEAFFMVCATGIANHKSTIGKLSDDKLYKITLKDDKFVKEKLKTYPLTHRQQEIALLSATGDSTSEIARKLFISPNTVKDHQKEIFRIIGIHSRNELFPKLLNIQ